MNLVDDRKASSVQMLYIVIYGSTLTLVSWMYLTSVNVIISIDFARLIRTYMN